MPATLIDVADFYIVQRPFNARGVDLERGEVVSCDGWVNVQPLINTRRLTPAPNSIIEVAVTCPCNRSWESLERADAHHCPGRGAAAEADSERRGRRTPKE